MRGIAALVALLLPSAGAAIPAKSLPHLWRIPAAALPAGATDEVVARRILARYASELGLSEPDAGLSLVRILRDGPHRVVRLQRTQGGLPVAGQVAAVRVGPAGALVHSHLAPIAALREGRSRVPTAQAAEGLVRKLLGNPPLRGPARVTATIWPAARPFAAWLVDLPQAPEPLTLRAIVDRQAGVVRGWVRLDRAAILAEVYETNPTASDLVEVDLPRLPLGAEVLEGRYADVARCRMRNGACQPRYEAEADGDGNFFFRPDDRDGSDDDPFAEVSAYYHVNRIRSLFDGLGLDRGELRAMRVWVNIPQMGNAAFSPMEPALMFGQGGRDFAYDGDVIYHEYTHAVVSVTARLEPIIGMTGGAFSYEPGVLNEALADTFSTTVSGDSSLGEYAGGYGWEAEIRDMDGDTRCPDHLIGEQHHDSQPFAQAAWEVRAALGDDVWLPLAWSMLTTLVPDSGPADAAEVLTELAAEALDEDGRAAVAAAIERHRLPDCLEVVALQPGDVHNAVGISSSQLTMGQISFEMPSSLQFSLEVPEHTTELTVFKRILMCRTGCPQSTYLRRGEPVRFELSNRGQLLADADHVVEGETDFSLEDPEPGTWYVATTNDGYQSFFYSLKLDLVIAEPEPEPDVGEDVGTDSGTDAGSSDEPPVEVDAASQDHDVSESPPGSGGEVAEGPIQRSTCACGVTGARTGGWRSAVRAWLRR